MQRPSFSEIVCGSEAVATAFDSHRAAKIWWRAVLWLHGKSSSPSITESQRRLVIANGFRFYAQLYRFLAVLFWLVALAAGVAGVFESSRDMVYWLGAGTMAGAFLWFASSLGFNGAKAFRSGQQPARLVLCTFMVLVIAFLSAFSAAVSVVVQAQTNVSAVLNLGIVGLVWAVGIGSYLIEVLYLVADNNRVANEPLLKEPLLKEPV